VPEIEGPKAGAKVGRGRIWTVGLLLIAMVTMVACSDDAGGDPANRTWQLTSLDGAAPVSGTLIDMTITDEGVAGTAGCNSYSGPATVSDGAMTLGPEFITTFVACDDATNSQEQRYLAALAEVTRYQMDEVGLTLYDSEDNEVAAFQ
jgi:heat shock protein HslJ